MIVYFVYLFIVGGSTVKVERNRTGGRSSCFFMVQKSNICLQASDLGLCLLCEFDLSCLVSACKRVFLCFSYVLTARVYMIVYRQVKKRDTKELRIMMDYYRTYGVDELSREQLDELKRNIYTDWSMNTFEELPTFEELNASLDIITDDDVADIYGDTVFCDECFDCTCVKMDLK